MTGKIFRCNTCERSQSDRYWGLCSYCIAAAVAKFLRTDPDTHLALAHIFEGDAAELEADIRRAIFDDLVRQYEVRSGRPFPTVATSGEATP